MGARIEIKSAGIEDLDAIYELAGQLGDAVHIDRDILEKSYLNFLNDRGHCLLIAKKRESTIGYLSGYFHNTIYANGKTAYVDEVVVSEKERENGVGKKLMREFEKKSKLNKCVLVSLATAGAKGFYEKLGYVSEALYYKKYLN